MTGLGTALLVGGIGKAAGDIIGGVVGNFASAADRDAAMAALQKAQKEIENLGAGPDLAKEIFFREFKLAGVLTPEIERAVDLGVSKVAQIQEDPRLKKAQLSALAEIQARGRTGFTAEEAVQLRQERAAAERSAEAKRQQILAGLRARGALDSGAGVAAQLQSADELATLQYEAADRAAAMAGQRALQAMTQGGQLAGQVRGQEFDIARTKAGSEEEMQRFNIANRMSQEQRRVAMENQARQYNLGQRQQLMNMNTQQQNAERLRQRQAQQQMYQNQMNLAQLRAGMYGQQAQQAQQRAGQTQQAWASIGGGLGSLAGMGLGALGQSQGWFGASGTAGAGAGGGPSLGVNTQISPNAWADPYSFARNTLGMSPDDIDLIWGK